MMKLEIGGWVQYFSDGLKAGSWVLGDLILSAVGFKQRPETIKEDGSGWLLGLSFSFSFCLLCSGELELGGRRFRRRWFAAQNQLAYCSPARHAPT